MKRVIVLFLIVFFAIPAYCQYNSIWFDHITADNGLTNSNVLSIHKDKIGYIWYGTKDGLHRYDGSNMVVYNYVPGDSTSITSGIIWAMVENNDQFLWIATENGLNKYDYKKDCFISYLSKPNDPTTLRHNVIKDLVMGDDGFLWVATQELLSKFDTKTNKVVKTVKVENFIQTNENNFIHKLVKSKNNGFWVLCDQGIAYFDLSTEKLTTYDIRANEKTKIPFISLCEDSDGLVWAGSSKGMFLLNTTEKQFQPIEYGGNIRITNSTISVLTEIRNQIWIGTGDGLYILDQKTRRIVYQFRVGEFMPGLLNDGTINCIELDNSGIIWIGTYRRGINYFQSAKNNFGLFRDLDSALNPLKSNAIVSFADDPINHTIWIGTDGKGLDILDPDKNEMLPLMKKKLPEQIRKIAVPLTILFDSKNNVWIGTWDDGLYRWNRKSGKTTHYLPSQSLHSSINSLYVWDLLEDRNGNIWIATMGGGLNFYNSTTGLFNHYFNNDDDTQKQVVLNNQVWCLFQDYNGYLWAGSHSGLSRIDTETMEVSHFFSNGYQKAKNALWISSINGDQSGNLWLGTYGSGLIKFNTKNFEYANIDKEKGLKNNVVDGVLLDNRNRVWLSTNAGISVYDVKNNTVENYLPNEGLQGSQYNLGAFAKSKSGLFLFGGTNGFNQFYPDSIKQNDIPYSIAFTDLKILNKKIKPDGSNNILKSVLNFTDSIVLHYSQSVVEIEFASLNFTNPQFNTFKYKLEGFNTDWIDAGSTTKATYTNLDPGDYVFRVAGTNRRNLYIPEERILHIEILPPWYLTFWVRLFAVITIAYAIIIVFRLRIANIKKSKLMLEQKVKDRTAELEDANEKLTRTTLELDEANRLVNESNKKLIHQADELVKKKDALENVNTKLSELNATKDKLFSIIAHDLKSPFNSLLGFSDLLFTNAENSSKEEIREYSKLLLDSATKAYDLLENLLHWSRAQRGSIVYTPLVFDLLPVINKNIDLFQAIAEKKQITIRTELHCKKTEVFADQSLIDIVVRNLINNAIKFTQQSGTITIHCSEFDTDTVQIEIEDNGVGIKEEDIKKLFRMDQSFSTEGTNREKGTGLGLILCKEFIELNKGVIWVKSKVNSGSRFMLTIPAGTSSETNS